MKVHVEILLNLTKFQYAAAYLRTGSYALACFLLNHILTKDLSCLVNSPADASHILNGFFLTH